MSDEQITIPKLTAQIVFDALVHSMDFGSGFLDTEEVEALRGLAVTLGVDPGVATPASFKKHYPHQFRPLTDPLHIDAVFGIRRVVAVETLAGWDTERNNAPAPYPPCGFGEQWAWCVKPEDDPIHQVAEDARMSA